MPGACNWGAGKFLGDPGERFDKLVLVYGKTFKILYPKPTHGLVEETMGSV